MSTEQAQRLTSLELKTTADGSVTLFVPGLQEHYHSVHGARNESEHVFLEAGLKAAEQRFAGPLHVLEIGLGTGLNAVLTLAYAHRNNLALHYHTTEAFPLGPEILDQVQPSYPEKLQPYFAQLHQSPWNQAIELYPRVYLQKWQSPLQQLPLEATRYQVVYFDAFAPAKQPELWEAPIFEKIYAAMQPGGHLVTYCAKGSVKRTLRAAGFEVEALPGPPGKREMTRARKPQPT